MSIPRKHHYLPEFYIKRWAVDGKVWRYDRPPSRTRAVHARHVPASSAAYKKDLYADPIKEDAAERQAIETQFFQRIDDYGARAFRIFDNSSTVPRPAKLALAQFVVSLLHRSPSRVEWIEQKLQERMQADPEPFTVEPELLRSSAVRTLAEIVGSEEMTQVLGEFRAYGITLDQSRFDLVLSDCPVMISNGILDPRGFVMFPMSPRRLVIFSQNDRVARAFSSQDSTALAININDAVVRQAEHVVIASSRLHQRFIDNRFLRHPHTGPSIDPLDGLMRWQVP